MNLDDFDVADLESSVENWMLSDPDDAMQSLGEDLIAAVEEELGYE